MFKTLYGGEQTIAYVLVKCYIFSSSGCYATGPRDMELENTVTPIFTSTGLGSISGIDICAYRIYIYTNLLLIKYFLKACLSLSGADLDRSHEH